MALRVDHHRAPSGHCALLGPNERSSFDPERCKQNAIFQVQAIKAGHISVIYRQTGGVLSVGSTGFAASW